MTTQQFAEREERIARHIEIRQVHIDEQREKILFATEHLPGQDLMLDALTEHVATQDGCLLPITVYQQVQNLWIATNVINL